MSNTIDLKDTTRQVKYRVVRLVKVGDGINVMLFSSDHYSQCEEFCWRYEGPGELEIRKVWVQK